MKPIPIRKTSKANLKYTIFIPTIFLLTACNPTVDEQANKNGCAGLRRTLQNTFVLAGWWREGQYDIERHEKKYGDSPLYEITTERRHGGYAHNNEKLYKVIKSYSKSIKAEHSSFGKKLVQSVQSVYERGKHEHLTFSKCEKYISIMMEDDKFHVHLWDAYSYPKQYDNYKKSRYRP